MPITGVVGTLSDGMSLRGWGGVVCNHTEPNCVKAGCLHAVPHLPGVPSLNGLQLGDCSQEAYDAVCCIPGDGSVRVMCVPLNQTENQR